MSGFTHEPPGGGNVEWYTPAWIFALLELSFDLDPCHPEGEALPWVPAERVYTKADNGLVKPWKGRIWLNPPYDRNMHRWLALMEENRDGVALFFSRTDANWFQRYVRNADGTLFLKKRVCFVDRNHQIPISPKTGKPADAPGSGSILVAWGDTCRRSLKQAAAAQHGVFADLT